jgi:hypothetical protein
MEIKDIINRNKDRNTLLHILRNPYGWSDETVRDVRKKAADELERLWSFEKHVSELSNSLSDEVAGINGEQP